MQPDRPGRFLNHVELVYRPGERALAARLFELLGFSVKDSGGRWISFAADGPGQTDLSNNAVYASEIEPEAEAFAAALYNAAPESGLGAARDALVASRSRQPQLHPHFGLRLPVEEQSRIVTRLEAIDDPELRGRVDVRVFRPEDPDSVAPGMVQVFVYTDIVGFATAPLGMLMELQAVVDGPAGA
jgi:hypothetical protein